MRRFARVNPTELDKIKARALDPVALKNTWIAISDEAEQNMAKGRAIPVLIKDVTQRFTSKGGGTSRCPTPTVRPTVNERTRELS